MMAPCTKWADRVYRAHRIPEMIDRAVRAATTGKPGPVYLDLPGDVLFEEVDESDIEWPAPWDPAARPRPAARAEDVARLVALLGAAERPVIISGMGVFWSEAEAAFQEFVEAAGIPFYTTPQGRGVVPEDHPSLPQRALARVPRGGPDPRARHAHELRDRTRTTPAVQRRRPARPDRHRCAGDRREPAAA